jgi:hypothetical protein
MTASPDPHFRPWGVVTADFWHNPAGDPPRPPQQPLASTSAAERPSSRERAAATTAAEPPGATAQNPHDIPPELLPMVREINRAINARRFREAADKAASAAAHIATTYGETHIYTTNIRALQAFIAERRAGHPR